MTHHFHSLNTLSTKTSLSKDTTVRLPAGIVKVLVPGCVREQERPGRYVWCVYTRLGGTYTPLSRHLIIYAKNRANLPRKARDKHREGLKTKTFLQGGIVNKCKPSDESA